ncbi:MAG: hypothetical protein R3C19_06820 [Planctomycetaceae bacterium]
MSIDLTEDMKAALSRSHGFLSGEGFVLMSEAAYRRMMGVESPEEYADSLAAVREGLADVEAGRTMSAGRFLKEFDAKHGL